ncbi:MAG: hypothetical protein JEZ11_13385 [Desulfobacterales bacterium]|nr:hypothetical protein [Desulfobacterales bacterium]
MSAALNPTTHGSNLSRPLADNSGKKKTTKIAEPTIPVRTLINIFPGNEFLNKSKKTSIWIIGFPVMSRVNKNSSASYMPPEAPVSGCGAFFIEKAKKD